MRNHLLLIIMGAFVIAGCRQDHIEAYRIPKSQEPAGTGIDMPSTTGPSDISWTVPSGWVVQPPSQMRVGSFRVPGKNGQTADVSVVPLAGEAGGALANINRWRQQIDLGPISEEKLKTSSKKITFAGRVMIYVNFVSDKPLIDNKFKKRIIAAILERNGQSWFFKMMGEEVSVREAEPEFKTFLSSIRFKNE